MLPKPPASRPSFRTSAFLERLLLILAILLPLLMLFLGLSSILKRFPARDALGHPAPSPASKPSHPPALPTAAATSKPSQPPALPTSTATSKPSQPPALPPVKEVETEEVLRLLQKTSEIAGTSSLEREKLKSLPLASIITGLLAAFRLDDPGMAEIAKDFLSRFKEGLAPYLPKIKESYLQASASNRPYLALVFTAAGPASIPIFLDLLNAKQEKTETLEQREARAALFLAAGGLGKAGGALLPALLAGCKDEQTSIRSNALVAVGMIGQTTPAIQALLKENLLHVDPQIRLSAAKASQILGLLDERFWLVLRESLERPDPKGQILALEIALALKKKASLLRPSLLKLRDHPDAEIASLAKQALAAQAE